MITDELASFMVEQGMAVGENVDVFFEDDIDLPTPCFIIQPFPGLPPERQAAKLYYTRENPSVSVTVRDTVENRMAVYKRAEDVLRVLDSISNRYIKGVWYLSVKASHSSPISLPADDQGRKSYTVNFEVMKNPSPTS